MKRPFESNESILEKDIEKFVDVTFNDLQSQFLIIPRGNNFLEFHRFRDAYELLKSHTRTFRKMDEASIWAACCEDSLVFPVLRTILGFSPPEWADATKELLAVDINQGAARQLDSNARKKTEYFSLMKPSSRTYNRTMALIKSAIILIVKKKDILPNDTIHRLDKVDTGSGLESLEHVARAHVPYSILLYERYLGRPFASHRDSVSELVGDLMENSIEKILYESKISFRRTGRAESFPGFEQAPDFFVPDEIAPKAIIEAKIISDDGTARDKVARILRLANMRDERVRAGKPAFEVIACIDGRGFGVRKQDMKDILIATKGKVFTLKTLPELVLNTSLNQFLPRKA